MLSKVDGQVWVRVAVFIGLLHVPFHYVCAQDFTDDVYDFEGYRAIVPLLSEDEVLRLDPGSEASDTVLLEGAAQEHERALFVVAFDGILWRDGPDRYAAQWYNRLASRHDSSWSYFRRDMAPFPRGTRMMGRSADFAWIGIASHGIHVRDIEDVSDRFFLADLNILDHIARFTFDPEGAFERYGMMGAAGELTREGLIPQNQTHVTKIRFVSERSPTIERLLYVRHRLPEIAHPEWWCFVVNNHRADVSVVYMIRLRRQADGQRALPVSVEDLRAAHHDVETIGYLGIVEHEKNPPPGEDRSIEKFDPASLAPPDTDNEQFAAIAWLVASTVALGFLIFQAKRYNQRKEGVRRTNECGTDGRSWQPSALSSG